MQKQNKPNKQTKNKQGCSCPPKAYNLIGKDDTQKEAEKYVGVPNNSTWWKSHSEKSSRVVQPG